MARITTLQTLVRSLGDHGTRPALLSFRPDGLETWSYQQLGSQINRLAAGFRRAGMTRDTTVALFAPNSPEWILIVCALFEVGAVPVPIDTQLEDDDLHHVLDDSAARWIVTTRVLADRLTQVGVPDGVTRILTDSKSNDDRGWRRYLAEPCDPGPSVGEADSAVLFYTSGTTGAPKGVELTHANLTFTLDRVLRMGVIRPEDRMLIPLPLHHVYPFVVGMLAALAAGTPIVLPHSPTGPQLVRALSDGEATVLLGVPRLFQVLLSSIDSRAGQRSRLAQIAYRIVLRSSIMLRRRLGIGVGRHLFTAVHRALAPRLRVVVSGGAALDPESAWKLEGLGWRVASGYGLTETSPILTFNEPGGGRIGSAGRPLEGVQLRLARSDSEEEGEILAKGPNVFAGYRNLPEETRRAFTEDGYFRTGDLGRFEDGYLTISGRAGSLIKLGAGEKIQPDRIEEVLGRSEWIQEVGVLEEKGQLAALVVPSEKISREADYSETQERVAREVHRAAARLPSHQRVAAVTVTRTPLPRTRLGKLRRHKLRDHYRAARQGRHEAAEQAGQVSTDRLTPEDRQLINHPAVSRVWTWLGERFSDHRVTPESHLRLDLGIESLDWIELTLALREHTGVELSQEAIGRIDTIRDLLREVTEIDEGAPTGASDPLRELQRPEELLTAEQREWLAPRRLLHRTAGTALAAINRTLMQWRYDLRVVGATHVPTDGPFLIIANHVSFLDPLAVAAALPRGLLRITYWTGYVGIMFRNGLMRWVSRSMHVVPVDPRSGPLASVALAVTLLRNGHPLVWFPEAQRSRDGTLQTFQAGLGMLLSAAPVPVVPAWIDGTHQAMPVGSRWPGPSQVTVTFGAPISVTEPAKDGNGVGRYQAIADAFHDRVERLAQEQPEGRRV